MSTHANQPQINMTPLIDVLLVMLIIFMVTTPTKSVGLEAQVPQDAPPAAEPRPERSLVIQIAADLKLSINGANVEAAELGARLAQIFTMRADRVLFISASPDLEFQHVAKVIDTAKGAGATNIGLLLKPL